MQFSTKDNSAILIRKLEATDWDALVDYLQSLSTDTKKRFGPHLFDKQSIVAFYADTTVTGYIAVDTIRARIIAYAITKTGYLTHDADRLSSYGLLLNSHTDATYAPSVADAWQGKGIAKQILDMILADLKQQSINRIILWGGVQADNNKAILFYRKNGFITLGAFNYNGLNYDMILTFS